MTGGTLQEVMAPHLPKVHKKGEQERRKQLRKPPALVPCPHCGPVRGAAYLCGLAMHQHCMLKKNLLDHTCIYQLPSNQVL